MYDNSRNYVSTNDDMFIITRWYDMLHSMAMRSLPINLKDRIGADDLAQETILIALINRYKLMEKSDDEVRAWLTVILKNRIKMAIRDSYSQSKFVHGLRELNLEESMWEEFSQDETQVLNEAIRLETNENLKRIFATLDPKSQKIISWYFFENRKLEWIAKQFGVSPRHARRMLRDALDHILIDWNNCRLDA